MSANEYPGTPRWVKVLGAIAALVLLIVIVLAVIGGDHGPQRHMLVRDSAQNQP
ncbi:MAG TPA: hypothetical protein VF057_01985 [Thermoanaerobaculia bacterium]